MIPDDQVEEVRARADIVEVIGEMVDLKKSGKEFKARCPFHEERTPSFYVVPNKGFYKCFGCGVSGDVFSFLMEKKGYSFVDAVKHVASRSGVEIREVTSGRDPEEDPNRPFYELNAFARDFYRGRLTDPDTGRIPRDYLESRGVDMETAERFGLGYAPDEWRALRDAAATHGFEDALMMEAGLLSTSEKSPEPYDRFRDRVIFPIEGLTGRVVAFGGRILGKDGHGPKYLNSPETPVYHKSDVLYGLSWAKHAIRRESAALVVEGYMDVVALAAGGFDNVVATLGTAMTEAHAALLSRYTSRVFLLFDSDAAGLRATFKAGDALLAAGLHPAVVTLPPGEDPDTLVQKEGAQGLRHYLDQAVDVLDRKLQILEEHDYFQDIEKIRRAVDRLLPTVRATADPALRDIYVSKVAEKTGVRRETLEEEMARRGRPGRSRGSAPSRGGGRGGSGSRSGRSGRRAGSATELRLMGLGAERSVLHVLLNDPELVDEVAEQIGPDRFVDPLNRRVFEALLAGEVDSLSEDADPRLASRVQSLREDRQDLVHARAILTGSLNRMRSRSFEERLESLRRELREADDPERRTELVREIDRLKKEKMGLGGNQGSGAWASLRKFKRTHGGQDTHE